MLDIGTRLAGKYNSYKITQINTDGKHYWYKLECDDFQCVEDLIDGILFRHLGQANWIGGRKVSLMPILGQQ